jgi:hypothetical protein
MPAMVDFRAEEWNLAWDFEGFKPLKVSHLVIFFLGRSFLNLQPLKEYSDLTPIAEKIFRMAID